MGQKQRDITIHFNLEDAKDRKIYNAIKNLPKHFGAVDLSEAFINFLDNMVASLVECEKKREDCEAMVKAISGETWRH